MKTYGVVMAGGGGTRFWPLSRKKVPKQLLNLDGKETMINETIDRLAMVVDREDIFVVTNEEQADLTKKVTAGKMPADHILTEPAARNTAACIGYAAIEIVKKYGDGIMCIVPSDHYIKDEEEFARVLAAAILTAEETDALVTIGIKPTFPSTGYGYIRNENTMGKIYNKVEEFVEKPDLDTASAYVDSGNYAWNSGMFIWKASTILKYFDKLLPDVYNCLKEIEGALGTGEEKEVIHKVYPTIPKISIDYGIMERADNVLMLEGDFGWNDVGSFDTLTALYEADKQGNVVHGEFMNIDCVDNIIYGNKRLITGIGIKDLIVVETEDAILVCDKNRAQDVKKIVEELERDGRWELL